MNESQLAALTETEEKNLRDWLAHVAKLTIPPVSVTVERRVLVLVLTALADARLEVARLTEELAVMREAVGDAEESIGMIDEQRRSLIHERDQQREDIRRLLRLAQDCMAEAVAFMLALKPEGIVWDWEATERTLEEAAGILADLSAKYPKEE